MWERPDGIWEGGMMTPPRPRRVTQIRFASASTPSARNVPARSRASATNVQVPTSVSSAAANSPIHLGFAKK